MTGGRKVTIAFALLLVVCLAGQALTVRRVDQLRPEATLTEVLYIPSAKVLRRIALGYDGLLADIYWTRAVQYFGGRLSKHSEHYELLYPLLDITTSLDPHLTPAYEFGATFLIQQPPMGSGEPEKAALLLRKGIDANPDRWQLYWYMGFVYYLELHDYKAASEAFYKAATMPNGNPNVLPLAAQAARYGGELETSYNLWLNVYQNTKQKLVRENAERHLLSVESDILIGRLEKIIAGYRERSGRNPESWAELGRAGLLRGTPVDPRGNPYRLAADGHVFVQDPDQLPFIEKGVPPGWIPPAKSSPRTPLPKLR